MLAMQQNKIRLRLLTLAGLVMIGLAPGYARAQSASAASPAVKEFDAQLNALKDKAEKMPLSQRVAVFVIKPAEFIGAYEERSSNNFKPGETLRTYIEPVGYVWKAKADGFSFGFVVDFTVKSAEGKILGGQENFGKFDFNSRTRLQEVMLNLSLTLDGITPGNYILEYKLHDANSEKSALITQAFVIAP